METPRPELNIERHFSQRVEFSRVNESIIVDNEFSVMLREVKLRNTQRVAILITTDTDTNIVRNANVNKPPREKRETTRRISSLALDLSNRKEDIDGVYVGTKYHILPGRDWKTILIKSTDSITLVKPDIRLDITSYLAEKKLGPHSL